MERKVGRDLSLTQSAAEEGRLFLFLLPCLFRFLLLLLRPTDGRRAILDPPTPPPSLFLGAAKRAFLWKGKVKPGAIHVPTTDKGEGGGPLLLLRAGVGEAFYRRRRRERLNLLFPLPATLLLLPPYPPPFSFGTANFFSEVAGGGGGRWKQRERRDGSGPRRKRKKRKRRREVRRERKEIYRGFPSSCLIQAGRPTLPSFFFFLPRFLPFSSLSLLSVDLPAHLRRRRRRQTSVHFSTSSISLCTVLHRGYPS